MDIVMPKNLKGESYYLKKKREERCRSRAGIEGLISHLKYDHRMISRHVHRFGRSRHGARLGLHGP